MLKVIFISVRGQGAAKKAPCHSDVDVATCLVTAPASLIGDFLNLGRASCKVRGLKDELAGDRNGHVYTRDLSGSKQP
ncbi:hypothetical protein Tco_0024801 [Tanacetum coccineum]